MIKKLSVIVGCILALAALVVLPLKVTDYFAKAEDLRVVESQVKSVEKRLTQSLDIARRKALEERNWWLQDKCQTVDPLKMPELVRGEYRRNCAEIDTINKKWGLK